MQKLVTGMTAKGFTLIEILIVIVIIGITVGFALIAFGDFGESRRILFSAEQLVNALKLTQQQAILETSTFGLRIENNSYQILKLQSPSHWASVSNKGIFKVTYFPKSAVLTFKTSNRSSPGSPFIIINASGEITPFTLKFGTDKETVIASLTGNHNGNLTFSTTKTQ